MGLIGLMGRTYQSHRVHRPTADWGPLRRYAHTPIRRHAPSLQLLDQSYPRRGSSSQRLDQLTRTFGLFRHLHAEQPRELGLEENNGPEIWMLALQIV